MSPSWKRLRRIFRPDLATEIDDELRFHLDARIAEYEEQGQSSADAERLARERFGDVERVRSALTEHDAAEHRREHHREVLRGLAQDVRRSARALGRSPGFVVAGVLSLALGIGATVTMFAIIDAIDSPQLPYPHAARLVVLSEARSAVPSGPTGATRWPTSAPTVADWRQMAHSYDAMATFSSQQAVLWRGDEADTFAPVAVSPDFFHLLGTAPLLGRSLTAADTLASAAPVVVLDYRTWRDEFGSDPDVVGKSLELSRTPVVNSPRELRTIVGVMPPSFLFPADAAAWIPARTNEAATSPTERDVWVLAGLRPGVSVAAANRELNVITRHLASVDPRAFQGFGGARVVSVTQAVQALGFQQARPGGAVQERFVEFGIAGFVLLIAVINVGTLLLARSVVRDRETAVRVALGASRRRIAQQLMSESAVIVLPGAVLGTLIATWAMGVVTRAADLTRFGVVPALDGRVLAFAVGLSVVVVMGTSLIPVLVSTRASLTAYLHAGAWTLTASHRRSRVHGALLVTQVACAFALVTGAGLLGKELLHLQTDGFGFDAHNLVWFPAAIPRTPLATPAAAWQFTEHAIADLRAVPGVASASVAEMDLSAGPLHPVGRPESGEQPGAGSHLVLAVSPRFTRQLRIPVLRGRTLSSQDYTDRARVALITASTAQEFWPHQDPIGREIAVGASPFAPHQAGSAASPEVRLRVVGVVANARLAGPLMPQVPTVFIPATSLGSPVRMVATFLVRTHGDPAPIMPALARHMGTILGAVPLHSLYGTTQQALALQLREQRLTTFAVVGLALVVVLMAALGVHGLVAYAVAQRTRELAIRMALGADAPGVRALVIRRPAQLAGLGVVLGGFGAWAIARALRPLLHGASPADPRLMAAAIVFVFAVVLLASWVPAARSTRVDPMISLRTDN